MALGNAENRRKGGILGVHDVVIECSEEKLDSFRFKHKLLHSLDRNPNAIDDVPYDHVLSVADRAECIRRTDKRPLPLDRGVLGDDHEQNGELGAEVDAIGLSKMNTQVIEHIG